MAITFYKLDAAVANDREFLGPALRLYVLMLSLADIKTRRVAIYIRDIAEKYKRFERNRPDMAQSFMQLGVNPARGPQAERRPPMERENNLHSLWE